MLFMVIETYRDGDAKPVYRRFKEKGRMTPHGARYLSSWVTTDFERCFQVMDCDDRLLLDEWISNWSDLIEFEVIPIITSEKATAFKGFCLIVVSNPQAMEKDLGRLCTAIARYKMEEAFKTPLTADLQQLFQHVGYPL